MKSELRRFNIVSDGGDGLGFALRLQDEGWPVRMWIRDREGRTIGDNMIEKVGGLEELIHDARPDSDVFVFDTSGNGVVADYLAHQDFAVLGGSILADRLERDRAFGYRVMEECGIETPETHSFTDFDSAIEFVQKHEDTRWVYKPSQQLGEVGPSHVSADAEDLIQMLQNIDSQVQIAQPEFELQAFEEGVAFSTELWFQHGELIEPLINHTLERKELMDDDLGPSGGCVGNITWFCAGCKVCELSRQLTPWARGENYHGMLDLNAIVNRRRVFGLEFTPRFGYDATPTLLYELVRGGLGAFLDAAARGEVSRLDLRDGYAGAVGLTIPPWPTERYIAEENVPIRGLTPEEERDAYWYNVKKDTDGHLVSAGAWGNIGLFTANSSDARRAMAKPLDVLRALKLKNKQFRTDLHNVFLRDIAMLEGFGVEINVMSETNAAQ